MNQTLGSRFATSVAGSSRVPSMTEKIWGHLYKCTVPAFQSRSVEDIRERGVIVTGIRDLDQGLKDAREKRWLTIDKMVEFFKRGVTVGVCDFNDTKDIYQ